MELPGQGSGLFQRCSSGAARRQFWEAGSCGEAQWEQGVPKHPGQECREEGNLEAAELPAQHNCRCSQLCRARAPACLGSGQAVLSDCPAGSEVAPSTAKSGSGLLPQEEGNAGRMSSLVAHEFFPMNPC